MENSKILINPCPHSIGMKTHTAYWYFNTPKHRQYLHITEQVEQEVQKSKVSEGLCFVGAMHTTAGVWINDNEVGLLKDIDRWLEGLAPFKEEYNHHKTGETNGDSHLKGILIHPQVIIPITKGKLDLGTWQRIFYAEFDGQRKKRVVCKIIGE